jgi:DNA-binding NarL/FixJ family response regulator
MSIFVIDERPLMREAIANTLRRLSPAASVAELNSLDAADAAALAHGPPELICVELQLASSNGVSVVHYLKQKFTNVPVVVFSGAAAGQYQDLAIEAGADAFMPKTASRADVTNALREFVANEDDSEFAASQGNLSKRQKQLLILLDKGMSNRDIAEQLEISEHTVKVHLWRLFRRLNVKSRSQASHLARTHGLLEPKGES